MSAEVRGMFPTTLGQVADDKHNSLLPLLWNWRTNRLFAKSSDAEYSVANRFDPVDAQDANSSKTNNADGSLIISIYQPHQVIRIVRASGCPDKRLEAFHHSGVAVLVCRKAIRPDLISLTCCYMDAFVTDLPLWRRGSMIAKYALVAVSKVNRV